VELAVIGFGPDIRDFVVFAENRDGGIATEKVWERD
jgi:hypothetical protein